MQNESTPPVNDQLRNVETLITAAVLTATPVDTTIHNKLFMSSSEFYQERAPLASQTLKPLDISDAVESLETLATMQPTSSLPTLRPGQRHRRSLPLTQAKPPPRQSRSRSPSRLSRHIGKIERTQLTEIERLRDRYEQLHAQIFNASFAMLSVESQTTLLDEATAFLKRGLKTLGDFDLKAKFKLKKGGLDGLRDERRELRVRMTNFYAKIYALYYPLIPTNPIPVNAGKLHVVCCSLLT